MKRNKLETMAIGAGILSMALLVGAGVSAQTTNHAPTTNTAPGQASDQPSAQMGSDMQAAPVSQAPIDQLVTLTCRQAWQKSGRNRDQFFEYVKQLAALAAQNRDVTLPDDKAAGARAGNWIRTQAIKDPDQLLYAVVDHAVQYSIAKGRTTPGTSAAAPTQ